MLRYILNRLFYGTLVIFGVLVVVFFIFHALPGDPVAMMAGQRTDVSTREAIAKDLGLDKPISAQFLLYFNDLLPLSIHQNTTENQEKYGYTVLASVEQYALVSKFPYMRRSFQNHRLVSDIIMEHVSGTFWLAFAAMLFATVLGITFGVIASLKQNTFADHFLVSTSILGISAPSFVVAILMAVLFGFYWADYTGLNLTGQLWVMDPIYGKHLELRNIILPALTLGIRPLSIIVQLTRSSMLDVLSQDYIRTAKAKGLSTSVIIFKHALKNALNPVITAVSGWLASLMAGAFFVELIFSWKGLGLVSIKAVENLDFPLVMGCTLFIALVFIVVNILVDILYAVVDPRVRLGA
jgi:ABC-type dipeptide/oligopeptide/nickel transport system permease component